MHIHLWLAALAGALVGHLIRRLTPSLLNLKNRGLPFRWPWVEILSAMMFALTSWRFSNPDALVWYCFCTLVLAAIATDYGYKLIPDRIQIVGVLLGLISSTLLPTSILSFLGHQEIVWSVLGNAQPHMGGFLLSLMGATAGTLFLYLLRWLLSKFADMEVMGFGDVKFMALLGAFLGPELVVAVLFPASIIGILSGLLFKLLFKIPHAPFGPPLAFGAIALAYFHDQLMRMMVAFYAFLFAMPKMANLFFFVLLVVVLILLMVRIRRRAAYYTEMIEKDYANIAQEIEAHEEDK